MNDFHTKFDILETEFPKLESKKAHLKSCSDLYEQDYILLKWKSRSPVFELELLN